MYLIAFDIGSRCGWCFGEADGPPRMAGSFEVISENHPGLRYRKFELEVSSLMKTASWYGRKAVAAYENVRAHPSARKKGVKKGPRGTNIDAAHLWGAFRSSIERQAYLNGKMRVLPIEQGKVGRVGKGANKKVATLQAMRARFPNLEIAGFDEADAVAVWLEAQKQLQGAGC